MGTTILTILMGMIVRLIRIMIILWVRHPSSVRHKADVF